MHVNYLDVTELSGEEVTFEQFQRLCTRYYWAKEYCTNKDIAEVACGTGQGLELLKRNSKSVKAGDYSSNIISIVKGKYRNDLLVEEFDAQSMPYPADSVDIIIIFEAIYYLPSFEKFINECKRVLRKNGIILISTANKDLYDFNPSPYTYNYYGVKELDEILRKFGFIPEFYGDTKVSGLSLRQKLLRPVKKLFVSFHLMPKSMQGKKLLKKIVFGKMVVMPEKISEGMIEYNPPERILCAEPNKEFKVILCAARRVI